MTAGRREFEVVLPIGHLDDRGQRHRHAVIRKMRGHEETLLYDPALEGAKLATELIRSCLVRLGDVGEIDSALVTQLYSADRNFLLLELRRITFGDRLMSSYACPHCGATVRGEEDLASIVVRRLAEPDGADHGLCPIEVTVELDDGYVDRDGNEHATLVLRLPTGADEEFVSPMIGRDPVKAWDALVLRCIQRFGDLPRSALEGYGVAILRDLTLADRQLIECALQDAAPGPEFRRTIECPSCQTPFDGYLDVSNFFFATN